MQIISPAGARIAPGTQIKPTKGEQFSPGTQIVLPAGARIALGTHIEPTRGEKFSPGTQLEPTIGEQTQIVPPGGRTQTVLTNGVQIAPVPDCSARWRNPD